MKTKKAVKGRFKITATGKLKRSQGGKRHLLTGKSSKRKRRLSKGAYVYEAYADTYKKMLGK